MNLHELEFQVSRANQGAIAALWKKKEIDVFVGNVQTIRYDTILYDTKGRKKELAGGGREGGREKRSEKNGVARGRGERVSERE